MIEPDHERRRPPAGEGFTDSVSFAFGDPEAGVHGLARIGVAAAEERASALAVLFSGTDPVAATASAGAEAPGDWDEARVGDVSARIDEPLARWRASFRGEEGGFELEFSAASPPLEQGPEAAAAQASGVVGYEQLCRVEGEVAIGGRRRPLSCLGQRGHGWGASPWSDIELARTVSIWLPDGPAGLLLSAVRPAGATGHGDEATTAFLVDPRTEVGPFQEVAEPRLSTTYDREGRQVRAGLELWLEADDELPRRAAGELACGTTLELGALRLDCAFFSWRMGGEPGSGRYDVLRRT